MCIYIYIYIHTHIHTRPRRLRHGPARLGVRAEPLELLVDAGDALDKEQLNNYLSLSLSLYVCIYIYICIYICITY